MTTVTLIMIIKNESKIIERCLEHVRKYVDYIVISDTGSTDNTIDIVDNFLKKYSIKGKVYQDEWKNFGHNRSQSLLNGQEWLKENNIQLDKNYFLTIDADMILRERGSFCKEKLTEKDAWMLLQETPSIKYYNMRMFRSDLPYQSIGVTHEYWACKGVHVKEGKLAELFIDDKGDGGCKSNKFARDISLLEEGLKTEPNNVRYYFYLAQSYSDSNDIENALKWYKKRIDAGGWIEEIFISHLRRGELYEKKCDFSNAVMEWLHAYEKLPSRSESLYRIVRHFRIMGMNEASMVFLEMALKIPYPSECILFVEYPVYNYKLIEELSIISYYIKCDKKYKKNGGNACQYLLLNELIPSDIKEKALDNSYFYIEKIPSIKNIKLNLQCALPYISSSSCLFYDDDKKIKGVVRAVNYSMDDKFQYTIRDEHQIVRTENYWIELDLDFNVSTFYKIDVNYANPNNSPAQRDSHIKGFEDIRICKVGDKIYGIAVSWEYGLHNHPSVVYFLLKKNSDDRYIIDQFKAIRFNEQNCQKNWTLFTENDRLYTIYSHYPLIILELDKEFQTDEKIVINKHNSYDLTRVRGSANPIQVNDERLVCVHEVIFKDTRKYYHRFLKYDKEWNLISISQPFFFNRFYVEFTLSMMCINNDKDDKNDKNETNIYIPISTKDNTTEFFIINYKDIEWTKDHVDFS
jgi:glycosyltransferase involved in cell wall biosynthesis